jgi:hypothetical protein
MNTFNHLEFKLEDISLIEVCGPFLLLRLNSLGNEKALNFHCGTHERAVNIRDEINRAIAEINSHQQPV